MMCLISEALDHFCLIHFEYLTSSKVQPSVHITYIYGSSNSANISSTLSLFSVGSGGGKKLVREPGGAGAAAGFIHQHGCHPANGECKVANGGARVEEGAGRPADAAGRPGPEDPQPQTETQRHGRDGRQSVLCSFSKFIKSFNSMLKRLKDLTAVKLD